jgi:hypothetical protein
MAITTATDSPIVGWARVSESGAIALNLQPHAIDETETRRLALETGMARDAAYDALQAYADAACRELIHGRHAKGLRFSKGQAELICRGLLSEMGVEMAHDWEYGPTAP